MLFFFSAGCFIRVWCCLVWILCFEGFYYNVNVVHTVVFRKNKHYQKNR